MRMIDYYTQKAQNNGLLKVNMEEIERLTFINDSERVKKTKIRMANIWYVGDTSELANFYTKTNVVDYNYEPYYDKNNRNFYWSKAVKENDIKITHSGLPRNIVDTLVAIIDIPVVGMNKYFKEVLEDILEDNDFWDMYTQTQLPETLVEGWGCYKINWNKDVSDKPLVVYYGAENVEFVYEQGRIKAILFKDYYTDMKGNLYLIVETRRKGVYKEKKSCFFEYEFFKVDRNGEYLVPVSSEQMEEVGLVGDFRQKVIEGYNEFLAVPCIIRKCKDTSMGYGTSIFNGRYSLFDDLDQALSQSANTVRKSTSIEYFNSDYLERDTKTGMPLQPNVYDRKYIFFRGGTGTESSLKEPIQISQPKLDFTQYNETAMALVMQIIQGIMSPATLGIDISRRDNAEAQREKEKITILTRNLIIKKQEKILKNLFNQLLCAQQLMNTGEITCQKFEIAIKYGEFADNSYENKLEVLGEAFNRGNISPEMYIEKLYGDTLSLEEKNKELEFLQEENNKRIEGEIYAEKGQNMMKEAMFGGEDSTDEEEND